MENKWILIVDDEEGILSVLKNSLKKLGDEYRVVTAPNGNAALVELELRSFDLVVTDYKMAGMNGLELTDKIHTNWPETRIILMTAYGSTSVENEASRVKVYRYLAKPLEIETFRQIVKETVGNVAPNPLGILFFSESDYSEINHILSQLLSDVDARCVFLTDCEGKYIACAGVVDNLPLARIASLLGGSIATFNEVGRILDNDENVTNLVYREGRTDNLYVINVGYQFQLIIVIERKRLSSRLGSVWNRAQKTVAALHEKFGQARSTGLKDVLGENPEQAVFGELQKILTDTDPAKASGKPEKNTSNEPSRPEQLPASEKTGDGKPASSTQTELISVEEAADARIITKNLEKRAVHAYLEERDRS